MSALRPRTTNGVTTNARGVAQALDAPVILIRPSRSLFSLQLNEVWKYRELLYFLTWRDIKVRYKQTMLGAAWAILQPVTTMVIFTVIFNKFAKISSGETPYPIFTYAGLLPWNLFANALNQGTASLVGSAQLITKVYFPRLIVPLSATGSGIVDFAIAFLILVGMMVWFGITPTLAFVAFPLFVLLALLTALAVGLWLTALNVKYRDVRHAVPFLIQIWMFISPVVYPVDLVPEKLRWLYNLNPLVGVIQGFRWALLGTVSPDFGAIGESVLVMFLLLIGGLVYFKRTERTLADVV